MYRAISALKGKKGLDGPSESAIRSVMLGATYPWGKKERLRRPRGGIFNRFSGETPSYAFQGALPLDRAWGLIPGSGRAADRHPRGGHLIQLNLPRPVVSNGLTQLVLGS